MDNKALEEWEWAQRELAKRLGLKKYKKYPAEPLRTLLSDSERREDLERARENEMEWEGFLPFARLAYQMWETAGPRESFSQSGQVSERAAEQLSDDTEKRSQVFSEGLAKQAVSGYFLVQEEDPSKDRYVPSDIENFRGKYLDDKLLSPQQAWALLTSPVAAHWPPVAFRKVGVPVVGHTYQVTEGLSDEYGPYSLVEWPLPSTRVESFKDRRPREAGPWQMWDEPENARSNQKPKRELKTPGGSWKILAFPGEDGRTHRVLVERVSVLGKLHDMVSRLIQRYPWEESDAVWFVLTGEPPQVAPFTWQARWFGSGAWEDSFRYGFVTLKIEPWIDPKLVWRVYTDIQRRLRGGKRNRRRETKSLELLRFVNERVDVSYLSRSERRKIAPKLVAAWDEENPDGSYEGDTRKFWKAYDRARQAVMSPTYEWPS